MLWFGNLETKSILTISGGKEMSDKSGDVGRTMSYAKCYTWRRLEIVVSYQIRRTYEAICMVDRKIFLETNYVDYMYRGIPATKGIS